MRTEAELKAILLDLKKQFGSEVEEIDWDAPEVEDVPDRVKACGTMAWHIDPETGKPYRTKHICGDYRRCTRCRSRRDRKEKADLQKYLDSDVAICEEFTEDEAAKIVRQLRDSEQPYERIPRPDNKVMILHNDKTRDNGERRQIEDLPFEEWLDEIPENKRIVKGGKKSSPQVKEEKSEQEQVKYQEYDSFEICTHATDYEVRECFALAAEVTSKPETWEEIPECINERLKEVKYLLQMRGHVIYDVYKRARIQVGIIPKWV